MFFDATEEILEIARRIGTGVFVVPEKTPIEIKNAIVLKPEEKNTITIEQIREVLARLAMRQTSDLFVLIRPADKLGEEAGNALLKSLEEPGEKVHFILVTASPSKLLTTILSRAGVYFLRDEVSAREKIEATEKDLMFAKQLVTAKSAELVTLADELTRKREGARENTLRVLATAIEILYKSYYKTEKEVFLKKLPKFLRAYENIEKNGHIKLHLVADLM